LAHMLGRLMYEALQGTKYIHARGIIHADYKPENIMLSAKCDHEGGSCHAKIADFGVSCSTQIRGNCDGLAGTPLFLSPEKILARKAHPSDDLWALGITLYNLMYRGRYPPALDAIQRVNRGMDGFLRAIGDLKRRRYQYRPAHDSPLERLLSGLLTADPNQRMSIDEASKLALEAASMGGEVAAAPADRGGAPPCWRMCDKSRCFEKRPMKPCLVTEDGSATACGKKSQQREVVHEWYDSLIEVVIMRGSSKSIGFSMDTARQMISKVAPGSPAEKAGLRVGDKVETIQHKAWASLTEDRRKEIFQRYPRVVLEVTRRSR